ncbi:MAG: DUF6160 family protein [Acidobacteriota bacterium]
MKKFPSMLRFKLLALAVMAMAFSTMAQAAVEELPDDALSAVSGEDGVTIMLHLEWNANALTAVDLTNSSSISVGFYDADQSRHTSLVFQGFGGIMDLWALRIDARTGPAGVGDYVDITMPNLVAFKQFGFRALYAESYTGAEPTTMPKPTSNYGKWLLDGSATVTGNVYIWPAK